MDHESAVVAVFADHPTAESAVKALASSGFALDHISVVGKGFHSEEKVIGFYNMGDRVKFWGGRGAFWGGLWGLFFGGLFLTIPVVGHVVVLGYLATVIVAAVENAFIVGGLSAIGAALFSIGVPKDSVLRYETDMQADHFLVIAHGTVEQVAAAKPILTQSHPSRIETHSTADQAALASA